MYVYIYIYYIYNSRSSVSGCMIYLSAVLRLFLSPRLFSSPPATPLHPPLFLSTPTPSVVLCALTSWSSTHSTGPWSSARSPRGPRRAHPSVVLCALSLVLFALTP